MLENDNLKMKQYVKKQFNSISDKCITLIENNDEINNEINHFNK